jgi:hypothetical protein
VRDVGCDEAARRAHAHKAARVDDQIGVPAMHKEER